MLRLIFRDKSDRDSFIFVPPAVIPSKNITYHGAFDRLFNQLNESFLKKEPTLTHVGGEGRLFAVRQSKFYAVINDLDVANLAIDDILLVSTPNDDLIGTNNDYWDGSEFEEQDDDIAAAVAAATAGVQFSRCCNVRKNKNEKTKLMFASSSSSSSTAEYGQDIAVGASRDNINENEIEQEARTGSPPLRSTRLFVVRSQEQQQQDLATSSSSHVKRNDRWAHGAGVLIHLPLAQAIVPKMSGAPVMSVEELFSIGDDLTASSPPEIQKQAQEKFRAFLTTARSHCHMFVDVTNSPELCQALTDALHFIKSFFDWQIDARQNLQMCPVTRCAGWNLMAGKRKDMLKIRHTKQFEKSWNDTIRTKSDPRTKAQLVPTFDRFNAVYNHMHKVGSKIVSNMYKLGGIKEPLMSFTRARKLTDDNNNNDQQQQQQQEPTSASSLELTQDEKDFFDPEMHADPENGKPLSKQEESLSSFFECFRYNNFCELEGSELVAQPCEQHCDVGMTTISCESSTSTGLQVYSFADHDWVDVEKRLKTEREQNGKRFLSVMFGDMLHYASNKSIQPTNHRVVMPPQVTEPRYSFIVEAIPYPLNYVPVVGQGKLFNDHSNYNNNKEKDNYDDDDHISSGTRRMRNENEDENTNRQTMLRGHELYIEVSRGVDSVNWKSDKFDKTAAI